MNKKKKEECQWYCIEVRLKEPEQLEKKDKLQTKQSYNNLIKENEEIFFTENSQKTKKQK